MVIIQMNYLRIKYLQLLNHLNIDKADFVGLSNGGRVISKIADTKPEIIGRLIYVASSSFMKKNKSFRD